MLVVGRPKGLIKKFLVEVDREIQQITPPTIFDKKTIFPFFLIQTYKHGSKKNILNTIDFYLLHHVVI